MIEKIDPGHSITYKIACVLREDTDYPARMIILCCSLECALDSWLPIECPAMTLVRIRGCAGRSESSLGAHAIL